MESIHKCKLRKLGRELFPTSLKPSLPRAWQAKKGRFPGGRRGWLRSDKWMLVVNYVEICSYHMVPKKVEEPRVAKKL
ncbi:hypothetical protein DAI22_07g268500 [Oryza sativa Japonica Group]|nr:hypothetical protein DAI22_07g268500 [Oryza sativa Japonica Group]